MVYFFTYIPDHYKISAFSRNNLTRPKILKIPKIKSNETIEELKS